MNNTSRTVKKVVSVLVTVGMIISMFACLTGLSVFAVDNTQAAQNPVSVAPVKTEATTAAAKNEETQHTHCVCGAVHQAIGNHTSEDIRTWDAYQPGAAGYNANQMPIGGRYYLTEDLTITSTRNITGGTFCCLNGHTVTFSTQRLYSVAESIAEGKFMVFTDCKGTGKVVHSGDAFNNTGAFLLLNKTGNKFDVNIYNVEFDLRGSKASAGGGGFIHTSTYEPDKTMAPSIRIYSGTFYGDNTTVDAEIPDNMLQGGIFMLSQAQKLYIYGGTFYGANVKRQGGVIYAVENSTVNVSGGTFYGGKMTYTDVNSNGTVISSEITATVNISGGTFNAGTVATTGDASSQGGVIYAIGPLHISGGVINGDSNGGNLYWGSAVVSHNADTVISGSAQIHGHDTANIMSKGGAVYLGQGGTINLDENGVIDHDGTSTGLLGGAVYVAKNKTLTVQGSGTITGKAKMGGGICGEAGSIINVQGGTISGDASASGGGICFYGTVNMTGGTVKDGKAVNSGGNIFGTGTSAVINISGGTVEGGKATKVSETNGAVGGNICVVAGSSLNVSGDVTVKDGTAPANGGNIYASASNAAVTGGLIKDGTTSGSGGNIGFYNGTDTAYTFTISGGTVEGGKADGFGGNIFTNAAEGKSSSLVISGGTVTGGQAISGGNIYSNNANNTVTVSDTAVVTEGKATGTDNKTGNGGNIFVRGTLTVSGTSAVTGGTAIRGGSIFGDSGSVINVQGGTVTGAATGESASGGSIYANACTVNVTGGAVKDGTAVNVGGNICGTSNATHITVSGGTVSGGSASYGGNFAITGNAHLVITGEALVQNGTVTGGGGNAYVSGEKSTLDITGGTVEGGQGYNGGNIGANGSAVTMSDGTVQGGLASYTGGNFALIGSSTFTLSGGTIQDGGAQTVGGGNISAVSGSPVINITGGTVQNGYGKHLSTANIYLTNVGTATLNISGGNIARGEGVDETDKYYGGVWASNIADKSKVNTINITGNPTIDDKVGCNPGSFVELTSFTGSLILGNIGDQVISATWDADYIASENAVLLEGCTYYKKDGAVTILKQAHDDAAQAVGKVNKDDVHLADRDAILSYNGYNEAAKTAFAEKYSCDNANLETMVTAAQDYATMMETKVEVRENFGEEGKVLYVVYSSVDNANIADYDYAQIVITINGKTVGDGDEARKITDVYGNVLYSSETIASEADFVYDTENGHSDKSDFVYYSTVSLTVANASKENVEYEFYARIYLTNGDVVEGKHISGKLADLLPVAS